MNRICLAAILMWFTKMFDGAESKIEHNFSTSQSNENSSHTNYSQLEIQWRLALANKINNTKSSWSDFELQQHFSTYPTFLRSVEHAHYMCALAKRHRCACLLMDPNQANVVSFFICFHSNRSGTCKQANSCAICEQARKKYALLSRSHLKDNDDQWKCSCRCAMHFPHSIVHVGSYACSAHCMEEKEGCQDYQPSAPELDCAFLFRHVPIPWFTGIPIAIAGALLGFAYYSRRKLHNLRCYVMRRINGRQTLIVALENSHKDPSLAENSLFSTNLSTVMLSKENGTRTLLPEEEVMDVVKPAEDTMLT